MMDCIVVGHNEVDFAEFAARQKQFESASAMYADVKNNSVLYDGERMDYMGLLNRVVGRGPGPASNLSAFALPSLGACYLTSFLRGHGHSADVVNLFSQNQDKLQDFLEDSPRAVAITTTYYVDPSPIIEVVKFVREHSPETKIIVGGPFIFGAFSGSTKKVLEFLFRSIGADIYVTDNQGETTLSRTLEALRDEGMSGLSSVSNLVYTTDLKTFQHTARAAESNSLEGNTIDWSGFDRDLFTPTTYMRTARSCPFTCAFCNYPAMSGDHTYLSVEAVEAEMTALHELGVRNLIFIDDTFNVPLPRYKKILRMMIDNKFGFNWVSFFRCSNADDEAFDLMKASGCIGVYLGIESGDQMILENMTKFAKIEKYRYGIKSLTDRGILSYGSFIAGFPGETEQSINNTIDFIQSSPPTFYNVLLYFHDTLASIHTKADKYGIKGSQFSWSHNSMDWREAVVHSERMFRSIDQSTVCPLYGFAIWAFPYLMENGMSVDQITDFIKAARGVFIGSLDDVPASYEHETAQMLAAVAGNRHSV